MSSSWLKFFLKSCVTFGQAKQIHAKSLINGFNHLEPLLVHQVLQSTHDYSSNVTHYVKQILYGMSNPDAFSWGCVIRFLSQHGQFKEAFSLYVEMGKLGVIPSSHAISSTLRACARIEHKIGGASIHAQVHGYGFYSCVYVQTALVDLYSKFGDMKMARMLFDDITDKSVVSWNSILSGHLKSGDLVEARKVFDEIPTKDVISWNSILSGYARAGDMDLACSLFQMMPEKNSSSWNSMISGYVDCGKIELARTFFDAMPQKSNVSWMTMISGYARCGDVQYARELFDQLYEKDKLSYNAMIACYAQNSQPKEALKLFEKMLDVHIQPDEITLSSIISACSQLGDVRFGPWVESHIAKLGIETDDHMATALIDLYMKCGNVRRAYAWFHSLRKKDVVSYSAMILGCGINGKAYDAIDLFEKMVEEKIRPNLVTFTGLLNAYCHAGLVEDGYRCFTSMKEYDVEPSVDHYGIMVDMLGRGGKLEEAYKLIKGMPMQPNAGVWGALLLASGLHSNVEFGELAAQSCIKLEPDSAGYLSLLANIYMSVGRWDDAKRIRKVMEDSKLSKTMGCSWVEAT